MTEEITEAIRNAFNEYLSAVDKIILENQALQIELQRLEQENNSLQAQLNNITVQSNNAITALEQENKEYKAEHKYSNAEYRQEREAVIQLSYYRNTYRSALEEIKEDMEQDTTCESRECGCDDYTECLNCIKETILNKINEVLK